MSWRDILESSNRMGRPRQRQAGQAGWPPARGCAALCCPHHASCSLLQPLRRPAPPAPYWRPRACADLSIKNLDATALRACFAVLNRHYPERAAAILLYKVGRLLQWEQGRASSMGIGS